MPNIPQRAKLMIRAACDAFGCTAEDIMVSTKRPAPQARLSAMLLMQEHLAFMGTGWIKAQLGYAEGTTGIGKNHKDVDERTHERARKIYSALMREAREREP